ncbi:hypothetical protein [Arthrobacter alkaliphilus]|uniref:hypothetical protein n=1 Tax=Arthrobacter alkaliphilus TaxID=369936 RepID=UPI001F3C1655|nr:hypothetical protein [Arthrobacter alkaliphilus]
MLGDPVELLARDVVVDLRGTLAVRAVGAAQVRGVGNARGALFPGSTEAASFPTWAIELAGTAFGAVTKAAALTVALAPRAVTKRLTVTITKATALTISFAARAVT